MDRQEEQWLNGRAEGHDLEVEEEIGWSIIDRLDAKDLTYLSVTVGLLASIIPWWTGLSLIIGLMSTSWLFVIGAVLFMSGTVLNLRNPVGMVGQIIGAVIFLVELGINYARYRDEFGVDLGHPEIGIFFAAVSIILCFLALIFGGYEEYASYQ
ncbi:MAG: hypothetical protein E4H30_07880 [Methanomassiliicoccus sp.]|nr:MAG: hypothetical protein E4H30_07880 [Methanomassiliicoccus sp.]